jgi:hypothetical protein
VASGKIGLAVTSETRDGFVIEARARRCYIPWLVNPPLPERNHALDALRASALLLGVLLHAALAYLPGPGFGWAVQDRSTHPLFGVLVLIIHSFRLSVFFLLAGYFGHLMHRRLGSGGFVRNRLLRILAPFAAGWLLVYPLLAFAWIWGAMKGAPELAPKALAFGYATAFKQLAGLAGVGGWQAGFPLSHLWFLYYLLLVYGLFLGVRFLVFRTGLGGDRGTARVDGLTRFLLGGPWGRLGLATATAILLTGMAHGGIDTPDKTFVPQLPALLLYSFTFALGWLLFRQTEMLDGFRRRWRSSLGIALLASVPVLMLAGYQERTAQSAGRLLYQFAYAFMMWSWILAWLGFFLRFCANASAVWRYLAEASYWVYIIHLPVVVTLQVALSRSSLPVGAKFAITMAVATFVSLVSYHLLVRSTPIGLLLNGWRHPFFPRSDPA